MSLLENYENYLIAIMRLSELTVKAYLEDIKLFLEYFTANNIDIKAVESTSIEAFLKDRDSKRKLSPSTHIRMLAAISHLYNYLFAVGIVSRSPIDNIKRPINAISIRRVYSKQEIINLIQSPNIYTLIGIRDRCILELLYATGIRSSELIKLRVIDIDISERTLFVRGKGNKERLLPLTANSTKWLENYLKVRQSFCKQFPPENLFVSARGKGISYMILYTITKKYAKKANLSFDFSPHAFRHSFATHLLHNGANIVVVKMLLGHERIDSTQIYTHLDDEYLEKIHRSHFPRA